MGHGDPCLLLLLHRSCDSDPLSPSFLPGPLLPCNTQRTLGSNPRGRCFALFYGASWRANCSVTIRANTPSLELRVCAAHGLAATASSLVAGMRVHRYSSAGG